MTHDLTDRRLDWLGNTCMPEVITYFIFPANRCVHTHTVNGYVCCGSVVSWVLQVGPLATKVMGCV